MTILNRGDIAVIGMDVSTNDSFSVVLLAAVDSADAIVFTENSVATDNTLGNLAEGTFSWTPPVFLTAGTVVTFSETTTNGEFNVFINGVASGTVTGTAWSQSTGGDQVVIYQGAQAAPNYLFAAHLGDITAVDSDPTGDWDPTAPATGGTSSFRPTVLNPNTNGGTSYSVGFYDADLAADVDSGMVYSGPMTSASAAVWMARITDANNWTFSASITAVAGANSFGSTAFAIAASLTAGSDTYTGSGGNDILTGPAGSATGGDNIDGGAGAADEIQMTSAGTFDLTAPTTLTGFEILTGTSGADRFIFNASRLAGFTTVNGGGGSDTLEITGGGAVSLAGKTLTSIESIELTDSGGTTLTLGSASQSTLVTAATGAADTLVMGAWEADFAEIDRLIAAGVETVQYTDGPGASTTGWTGLATAQPGGGYTILLTDTGATGSWASVTYTSTSGSAIDGRFTVNDDGTDQDDAFVGGFLTHRLQTDPLNAAYWTNIETNYSAAGVIQLRIVDYDDGIKVTQTFTAGALTSTLHEDTLDAFGWTSVTTNYTAGQVTQRISLNDDGIRVTQNFTAGALTSTLHEDTLDAFGWTSVETNYTAGQVTSRISDYDDGNKVTQTYTGGVLTSALYEDTLDAYAWATVATTYGVGAAVTLSRETRDSGVQIVSGFAGSQILAGGAFNDYLFGGADGDVFAFGPAGGFDRVMDFADGADLINLTGFGVDTLVEIQAQATLTDTAGGLHMDFGGGQILLIAGFDLAHLGDADFDAGAIV